jgi:hypothetical protein
MRQIIRISAGLFIWIGVATCVVAAIFAAKITAAGGASLDASYPLMFGFMAAIAGIISGASIVLVGGTAYLLSSIDERIERVAQRVPASGTAL